jgi:hypothetical protein
MSLTKVTNSMISGAPINVLDYGADPTGGNDSLAAFNAAIAAGSYIVIPVGTYKLTGTFNVPQNKTVAGLGYAATGNAGRVTLVPTAAVTGAAIELEGTYNWLSHIYVDGTATTGVIGLRVGNVPLANLCYVTAVECDNFYGAGGKGLQIINTVGTSFTDCRFNKNQECVDIGTLSSGGCPTTTTFNGCYFREATGVGVVIRTNFDVVFNQCLWEANYQSGMAIDGSSGNVCVGVTVNGGWCEGNWRSLTGAPLLAEAHFEFIGTGGDVENITVNGTLFSGSATSERAIKANTIYDLLVNAPITSTTGGAGMISTTSCTGWLDNWRAATGTGWTNTGGSMQSNQVLWNNVLSAWTDWTPSFTTGAMTFTGVTITTARYKQNGKTLLFELEVLGTIGGTPGANMGISLPLGNTSRNTSYLLCYMVDNAAATTGFMRFDGTNTFGLYRLNSANFTAGAFSFTGSFTIEID